MVDRFLKIAHCIPLKNGQAENIAKAFVREICSLHGLLLSVVSARDTIFTSKLWLEVMRLLNI